MTLRKRRRRRKRWRIIKRLAAFGLLLLAVGGVAFSTIAATSRQGATEPPFANAVEENAAAGQKATAEPTTAPQKGLDLGWSAREEYMAARMAMAEAEGEDTEGKALVILVIYNREKSGKFPDTVKGVISQQNAFTSYSNGRYAAVKPDADCWAALDLIRKTGWDESQGALYFERTPEDGESTWHSRNLEQLFIHGNHAFYTEKEARTH